MPSASIAPASSSSAAARVVRCGIVDETSAKQARYLSGELGVFVTQMNDPALRDDLVAKIEKLSDVLAREDYPSDEILVGRAGFLSGVLWIRHTIDPSLISNACVQKVLSAMIRSGKRYSSRHNSPCPLMYDYHGTEYLGAAHGLAERMMYRERLGDSGLEDFVSALAV